MSDYMAAEIHIGGKVRRGVAQTLCSVIAESGASLEWDTDQPVPDSPDDLLLVRSADESEPHVLKFHDDQARWGQFEDLETFLQGHGIAYRRWTEGKYDYDAEVSIFDPQLGQFMLPTNHEREPIVVASQLTPIEAKLATLLETMKRGDAAGEEVLAKLEDIQTSLHAELPPAIPPLETFEIVED